ncbi:hypothetical protein PR048_019773 [Dryococelus australis]|uniref:ascorbate ferrireductase (transmembrane) n=1 Tax=Dryococelus australis TaxID=614101 RepID=A0ABQ9H4E9_9NEOP|nr:hypothetical protein PR048_019773 [Dryococelus australis]
MLLPCSQSVALMSEAILALRQKNVPVGGTLSRRERVRIHWILQVMAGCLALAGFSVVVANKNLLGKPHFASIHGMLGLAHVILSAAANCGGVATLFSTRLKNVLQPTILKLWHSVFGAVAFTFGIAATITGLYTRFFRNAAGPTVQVVCAVLLIMAAVLTLEGAVKSAYARFRSLYRK